MFRSLHTRTVQRRGAVSHRAPVVCVVDRQVDDYQGWQELAQTFGVRLLFAAGADEALRLARTAAVDLWVVNTNLAGVSGAELCAMLKQDNRSATVYLVNDDDSLESQRTAWAARPTVVGCKGEHHAWLRQWIDHRCHESHASLSF